MKKLVSKRLIEKFPIYDITVKDDHCFELHNGIIAHNSMYSTAVISGGCIVAGTKIRLSDGSIKNIEDIQIGDKVYTIHGSKKVTHIWNPETLADGNPECLKVTFSDATTITCSENHMFLDIDRNNWIIATDLKPGVELWNEQFSPKHTKVTFIEHVGVLPVYDITVEDAQSYVMENGLVSHNTGLMYSANQAFIITKAQEKDGDELAGWKFTINVEKSRYVKEKSKLPFTVLYNSGIQKWSALFDLALESGHLIKPKMGWYQTVNMETGEVSEKSYRAKDFDKNPVFYENLIKDPLFKSFVEKKYKLSGNNSSYVEFEEDVDIPDEE